MNKLILIGNLTKAPKEIETQSDLTIATLSVAVNSRTKKGEEWVDKADFFNIKVFGKKAENCLKYLVKGQKVAIEGKLSQNVKELDNGDKKYYLDLIANNVEFLSKPSSNSDSDSSGAGYNEPESTDPINPDDIPF